MSIDNLSGIHLAARLYFKRAPTSSDIQRLIKYLHSLEGKAEKLMREAKKRNVILMGHRPKLLKAAAVYVVYCVLGDLSKYRLTQQVLSIFYGVSEVGLRSNYKLILATFNVDPVNPLGNGISSLQYFLRNL